MLAYISFVFFTIHAFDRRTDRQTDGQTDFSLLATTALHRCSDGKKSVGLLHLRRYAMHPHPLNPFVRKILSGK